MKIKFIFLWFISLVFISQQCCKEKTIVPEYIIDRLFQLVLEGQVRSDIPDLCEQCKVSSKGNYQCVQMIQHISDQPRTTQTWQLYKNLQTSTVPIFVTTALLESYLYGSAPRPSDEQLMSTLEYCYSLRDVYKPYNSPITTFAPCDFDEDLQICVPAPSGTLEMKNLHDSVTEYDLDYHQNTEHSVVEKIVNGFCKEVDSQTSNNLALFSELFYDPEVINFKNDSDATFLWLGLGSTIEMLGKDFPLVQDMWSSYRLNISSAFDALTKYAYRPFSSNPSDNTVDSANYYYIRHFLDDAKAAGNDVAIIPIMFTNAEEKPKTDQVRLLHKMMQEIDLVSIANVVNSITVLVLSGLVGPEIVDNKEIAQIYHNSSALIAYLINSNFTNRPDLALMFYPSRYLFYWIVARTVSTMDIYKRKGSLPVEHMDLVFNLLNQALEGEATRFIISDVKRDDDAGSLYFDDFLGNGDLTVDNKPIIRGEDRIFTTAMAVNALMYTWLTFDPVSRKSHWKNGTPESVKDIVDGCVLWLVKNTLEGKFKPWNVFLITQNKGIDTSAHRYPSNHFFEMPQLYALQFESSVRLIAGVQGYIPKNKYEAMLNKTHFGKPTPTVFKGFNHPDFGDKLFWSSDPYTYTVTLLALSRYREIEVSVE